MALPDSKILTLAEYVRQYKMLVTKQTDYILDNTTVITGEIYMYVRGCWMYTGQLQFHRCKMLSVLFLFSNKLEGKEANKPFKITHKIVGQCLFVFLVSAPGFCSTISISFQISYSFLLFLKLVITEKTNIFFKC